MERLTKWYVEGIVDCGHQDLKETQYCEGQDEMCSSCELQRQLQKLAAYEQAEETGLLIKLPVAVGQTVWIIEDISDPEWCAEAKDIVELDFDLWMFAGWGDTVFATREAAEEALREQNS